MKRFGLMALFVTSFGVSGCITDGQGVMARALNNSIMPDVDESFCLTMKGQPESVFRDFVKKNKMVPSGTYSAIGELYPSVHTYQRGNFRAAVTFGQPYVLKIINSQYVLETDGDPTKPVKFIECWKGTSPEPPGRQEYIGVKM